MPNTPKANVKNLTAKDMRNYMYGAIQTMIEGQNKPDNVVFQYFMPPIPFGPELASFMDIGPKAKAWKEEGFTVQDMTRAAVNFATIVDYVPVLDSGSAKGVTVDLNSLVSSGIKISNLYESILNNCRIFNNERSDTDREKLRKLREMLFVEVAEPIDALDTSATDTSSALGDDDLLAGFGDDADIDLANIFDDGASLSDMITDPNALATPTKAMKLYDALMSNYEQTVNAALIQLKDINPNDPNAGLRVKMLKRKIRVAAQRWETQGHKTKVESIIARIEQLSQGGMPEYLAELRQRFEGNLMSASLFADEEFGSSLLSETAYYTALRPNGILSAPSLMKLSLSNRNYSSWSEFESSTTSAGVSIPLSLFKSFNVSGNVVSEKRESEFFTAGFEISFEIVQGLIDRPWFSKDFIECRAYSTVDPNTGKPIDAVNQITQLSDGKVPPKAGKMPALPVTAYFIRNLKVKSSALKSLSDYEKEVITGSGGISIFGFGENVKHESTTITNSYSSDSTSGEITANGTYLVGMSSVYLSRSPDPDFDSYPKEDWL